MRAALLLFIIVAHVCFAFGQTSADDDDDPRILWMWSGAVTDTTATFRVRSISTASAVRVLLSLDPAFQTGIQSTNSQPTSTASFFIAKLSESGLQPNTMYYYVAEIDGVRDTTKVGRFKTTVPAKTPMSFTFAFSSCTKTGADSPVFAAIDKVDPLFLLHLGDFHYSDICGVCGGGITYSKGRNSSCLQYPLGGCGYKPLAGFEQRCVPCENQQQHGCLGPCDYTQFVNDDLPLFLDRYEMSLRATTQNAAFLRRPTVFMWDDHDYGPNDSHRLSPTRKASRLAYQIVHPHFPLVESTGSSTPEDIPNYTAFSVGRVRFLLTDLRSLRDPTPEPYDPVKQPWGFKPGDENDPANPNKTMMGVRQKLWFKNELATAGSDHQLIVWVSAMPWLGDLVEPGKLGDGWWSYTAERRELSDYIQSLGLTNKVVMLNGDAHMIAYDDGSNNRYASNGGKGFAIALSASFVSRPQTKGMTPYSQGRKCTTYRHPPSLTNHTTCDTEALIYDGMYPGKDQFSLFSVIDDGVNFSWNVRGYDSKLTEIVSMFSDGKQHAPPPGPQAPAVKKGVPVGAVVVLVIVNVLLIVLLIVAVFCCLSARSDSSPRPVKMAESPQY